MAQNLKLEIFKIAIKKRNSKSKEFLEFKELFESIGDDKKEAYRKFIADYRGLFDGKFKSDGKGSKSISTTENNNFTPRSISNIIDGEISGGSIGSLQTIFNQDNAVEEIGRIELNQIASLPFFLKLWTPFDNNSGILMIQNYTDHTVADLIKITLKKFIAEYGFTLVISPFIPNAVKQDYIAKSHVYEMKIINDNISRSKRKLINPIFADENNLKVTVTISGFKKDVKNFWGNLKKQKKTKLIGANLEDLDISEENGYEIKAYYKDENGHKANVAIRNTFDLAPTIFLPEELKSPQTHHFDYKKIKKYTDGILETIKQEIGYIN